MKRDPASADSESEEEEDDELLMAAAAWAKDDDSDDNSDSDSDSEQEKSTKGKGDLAEHLKSDSSTNNQTDNKPPRSTLPQNFSLHLTKVPYEATQGDIRFAFGEKGCHVTSVRLVYDRDQKTGERHFRGVAFVDLADEKSFKRGLEFHNKAFLGKKRRVNVRPTRTKGELSEIVRKTEEKVANLIARSKEKKREREDDNGDVDGKNAQDKGGERGKKRNKKRKKSNNASDDKKDSPNPKPKQNNKDSGDKNNAPKKKAKAAKGKKKPEEASGDSKNKKPKAKQGKGAGPSSGDGSAVKLTKKQRAKKAAVIRMMKLKRK